MTVAALRPCILALTFTAGPALPVAAQPVQQEVMACFAQMGATTAWGDCLSAMFAPCADEEVGSEAHLACLAVQRDDWRAAKAEAEGDVVPRLTEDGMAELSGLMLAWPKFVDDKCAAVAEGRAAISFEAARLGCQVSELALMTNELTACAEGRSVEDYCDLKDD